LESEAQDAVALKKSRSVLRGCPEFVAHGAKAKDLWGNSEYWPGYGMSIYPMREDPVKGHIGNQVFLNGTVDLNNTASTYRYNNISYTPQRVLIGDSNSIELYATFLDPATPDYWGADNGFDRADPERHGNKRANYVFFDLHAAPLPRLQAWYGLTDPGNSR
jgi:prepilin-type processing-associated H-X9-DG protein